MPLTWLLMHGIAPADVPAIPPWREPTHTVSQSVSGKPYLPENGRHLTPPAFAEWLVAVARLCG